MIEIIFTTIKSSWLLTNISLLGLWCLFLLILFKVILPKYTDHLMRKQSERLMSKDEKMKARGRELLKKYDLE